MVPESEYVALTQVHLHLFQRAVFDEDGSCFGDSAAWISWVDPEDPEEEIPSCYLHGRFYAMYRLGPRLPGGYSGHTRMDL